MISFPKFQQFNADVNLSPQLRICKKLDISQTIQPSMYVCETVVIFSIFHFIYAQIMFWVGFLQTWVQPR